MTAPKEARRSPTLLEYEFDLRLRIYTHCGPAEYVNKFRPAGVTAALEGEDRFAVEMGLTPEERAARVQLIPGHNLEVYLGCLAAYEGQSA